MLKMGHMNWIFYNIMMKTGPKRDNKRRHAGRGMYISERYDNTSRFGGEDGLLVEVHIEKGTPHIDITNPETIARFQQLGLSRLDFFDLNPKVLIRFDDTHQWWVIKSRTGVWFSEFHEANAIRLLKSRHRIIRDGGTDKFTQHSIDTLRKNVVDHHGQIKTLPEVVPQNHALAPERSRYLWRTDSSCGWYSKNYQLIQHDIPLDFCRNSSPTSHTWFNGQCRETVTGHPQIVIQKNVNPQLCPLRFRHKGKCAKLRKNEIVFIKNKYCKAANI